MHKNGTSGLQLILIDKREDPDVVLGPNRGRDNGVILVNELLETADAHGGATEIVDLRAVLLVLLLLGPEPLLVGHELLLHQEIVFDALQLQEAELALGQRSHVGEPARRLRALLLPLLAAHAGGRRRRLEFLLLFFAVIVFAVAALAIQPARWSLTHFLQGFPRETQRERECLCVRKGGLLEGGD